MLKSLLLNIGTLLKRVESLELAHKIKVVKNFEKKKNQEALNEQTMSNFIKIHYFPYRCSSQQLPIYLKVSVLNKTRVLNEIQVLLILLTKQGSLLGKTFQFAFCFSLLLPVNKQGCYNGFPCVSCFSTFIPFISCLDCSCIHNSLF